jgi:hypothetical protein
MRSPNWARIRSICIELLRPAGHWLTRYPLFLIVTGLLLMIAWGKRLQGFDAFFLIWHEERHVGMAVGATLAVVLGFFWYVTYLIDQSRAIRDERQRAPGWWYVWEGIDGAPEPRAGKWWGYLFAWWLTVALFALPAALPGEWSSGEPWPSFAESDEGGGIRYYFPEGLLIAATAFSLVVLGIAAIRRPKLMRWFGNAVILSVIGTDGVLSIWHANQDQLFCPIYSAAVNFLLLAGFVGAVYGGLLRAAARWKWADLAVYPLTMFLALAFLPGIKETEHRLLNLDYEDANGQRHDYYEQPVNLFLVPPPPSNERKPDWIPQWELARHAAEKQLRAGKRDGPEAKPVRQIDSRTMLLNWKEKLKRQTKFFPASSPPPAVVVTVSGGASTSALYTACLLFDLEDAYPGFGEQIVLITGASGGMVGAAYYVSHCEPGGIIDRLRQLHRNRGAGEDAGARFRLKADQLRDEFLAGLNPDVPDVLQTPSALHADFLTPVIQKWIAKDAPFNFVQRTTKNDRGRALEVAWNHHLKGATDPKTGKWNPEHPSLDVPLSGRASLEEKALVPALVFAPMMVEDGRQLLISNLDLDALIEAEAKPEPYPAVAAVEFFKLFRGADQFRLGTAVRMQASFPFISPAATLPTNPVRRVVDAGYYDNYGVNVALKWIINNAPTLHEVAPAVRLITIYTYGYESNMDLWTRSDEDAEYRALVDAGRDTKERVGAGGFKSATTPVSGLFSSWRANMIYRAEDRIGYVASTLKKYDRDDKKFFDRLRIPGPPDPPMNWYLRSKITDQFESQYGFALRSMAYLKSANTNAKERLWILQDPRSSMAFPVLKDLGELKEADLADRRSPALRRIYESVPVFNDTTDKLAEMMPRGPTGSNAVRPGGEPKPKSGR